MFFSYLTINFLIDLSSTIRASLKSSKIKKKSPSYREAKSLIDNIFYSYSAATVAKPLLGPLSVARGQKALHFFYLKKITCTCTSLLTALAVILMSFDYLYLN